jgi:hypothetical protein
MQRRMLSIAALATLALAAPIGAAQGATASKSKIARGLVYGGVTASGFPVVIELSKTATKVVRATIGLELTCQVPGGDLTLPDSFTDLAISKSGRFSYSYGPEEVAGDPGTPVSKVQVFGSITGTVNKAKTRVKGTWNQKVVAYSAADPTGATVLDTCDSGVVTYSAKQ